MLFAYYDSSGCGSESPTSIVNNNFSNAIAGNIDGLQDVFGEENTHTSSNDTNSDSFSANNALGFSRENPVPLNQPLTIPNGLEVTVNGCLTGSEAWSIIQQANMFNEPPEEGCQF